MQVHIIDAFTKLLFQGNPAATILVDQFPSDRLMQKIAAEINLSETAFAAPLGTNHFHLRWFTPTQEVNLCGHATLAMAHYLKTTGAVDTSLALTFATRSGNLEIAFDQDLIAMNFPTSVYAPCPRRSLLVLAQIFATTPHEVLGIAAENITVLLPTATAVLEFSPNFELIRQLEGRLIITAIGEAPYDFVSRFFAPNAGIDEDPVTGSAHCCLVPYWSKQLGKIHLKAKQLSRRSGELDLIYLGDRLVIKGYAITTLKGELQINGVT